MQKTSLISWPLTRRIILFCLVFSGEARAAKISISCGGVGTEFSICQSGAQLWAKKTGNEVEVLTAPNSTNERLSSYQQILAAKSSDIDVFTIDLVWPGMIGSRLLDLGPYLSDADKAEFFPAALNNNIVAGRVIALPWYTDAGLLYYRKDLLKKYGREVPKTWPDMSATAQFIQDAERKRGDKELWGYVFQGRAYEGLTCNAVEWIGSYGGGTIVNHARLPDINNAKAAAALTEAASWIGRISPRGVLNYSEEEARGTFQSGKAIFMRNWPYAWPLLTGPDSTVRDKVGIAPLPTATLGGWSLAVSKYSKEPKLAADLVLYLTGSAEQKRRALVGAFNPTRSKLYRDPEIQKKFSFISMLKTSIDGAVLRPASDCGTKYNRVSAEFWDAVHNVLAGRGSATENLKHLQTILELHSRNGKW